jgi:hypothetical protein
VYRAIYKALKELGYRKLRNGHWRRVESLQDMEDFSASGMAEED